MNIKSSLLLAGLPLFFIGCNQPSTTNTTNNSSVKTDSSATKATVKAIETGYHLLTNKDSIKHIRNNYPTQLDIILAVNRTDSDHIAQIDTLIVPDNLSGSINQYSPFPQSIPYTNIKKVIIFSYLAEYFAAYQNGQLVRTGPTNMGREKDQTPTGLFFTNWKAEDTKSTFNDEWDLKWNFNILNKEGIGFHQYSLPGYPASHSCLRLQAEDAKFLYTFADEWKTKGKDEVLAQGTPVVVFGQYPFGSARPWRQLATNPHALDISTDMIKQQIEPKLNEILAAQSKRDSVSNVK